VEQPAEQYVTAEGQPVQYVTADGQLVTYAAAPAVQSVQYVQQPAVYNVPPEIFAKAVAGLCPDSGRDQHHDGGVLEGGVLEVQVDGEVLG